MNNISFDNPWLLLVALPLILVVIIPFAVAVKRDNLNVHNVASLGLHIVMCVCVTLAFAGMTYEAVITETNVYVLADVSYSSEHSLDDVQENIEKISRKLPSNSKMGVICFGRDHQLISDLGGRVPDVRTSFVDRSATDIASALRYAGNLFDDGVIKRIIVITDGAETVSSNNIVKVVSSLQDVGVYVDAVYLDNNLPDDVRELQIDSVAATSYTYQNKTEEVQVLVTANCGTDADSKTQGYISLYKDDELIKRQPETFYNGMNVARVSLSTEEVGTFNYEVRVEPLDSSADYSTYNNRYLFTQRVTDERNVLFLGAGAEDINAGKRIYGNTGVTYLTVAEKSRIPYTVEELCIYDEIVLCNFDVREINARDMFLTSLDTLVNDYGKTLTTFGNTFIQEDANDAALKKLSGLLPVTIGNNEQDKRLVALVMDISLSMDKQGRLEIAKSVAKSYLNKLNATDSVMIIGFSDGAKPLLYPTPLTTPSAIIEQIDKITAENGTNLSNALINTKEEIDKYNKRFRDKQVIIISDGNNPAKDNPAAISAAVAMSKEGIAVSAVGILEADDGEFLNSLVNHEDAVKGVYHQSISSADEVDAKLGEIEAQISEVRIEENCAVEIMRPGEEIVSGIDGISPVNGFWYSSNDDKNSQVVLAAKYYRNNVDYTYVPLYAYWSAGGNGKVVSFLSDITGDWLSAWTDGTGGGEFLSNIADATLPDERIITPFIVNLEGSGNSTSVRIDASSSLQNTSSFNVTVTSPDGFTTTKTLTFASGSYIAAFSTDAPGTYKVHVDYTYNNLHYEQDTEFCISYYAEYDSFVTYNQSGLYSLLSENGVILELDEIDRIENSESVYTSYVLSLALPLMVACAALFVADIIVRHLRWKDVTSFFSGLFRRRK